MFHVCRTGAFERYINLVNGVMGIYPHLGNGVLATDLNPTALAIWLQKSDSPFFAWRICVNTLDSNTPVGEYLFTDETGDSYSLMANTPYLHTVDYNSVKPDIIKIFIKPTFAAVYLPGDWASAPICSGSSASCD